MAKTERVFQQELKRSFDHYYYKTNTPYFYHKIVDDGTKKPADAFGSIDGLPFVLEYKMNKLLTTINIKAQFKDRMHQIENLKVNEKKGLGVSFILINWYVKNKIDRSFAVSVTSAEKLLETGTVSMNIFIDQFAAFELERELIGIPRNKKAIWNITPLFDELQPKNVQVSYGKEAR